jgi:hypothetical protein
VPAAVVDEGGVGKAVRTRRRGAWVVVGVARVAGGVNGAPRSKNCAVGGETLI